MMDKKVLDKNLLRKNSRDVIVAAIDLKNNIFGKSKKWC